MDKKSTWITQIHSVEMIAVFLEAVILLSVLVFMITSRTTIWTQTLMIALLVLQPRPQLMLAAQRWAEVIQIVICIVLQRTEF